MMERFKKFNNVITTLSILQKVEIESEKELYFKSWITLMVSNICDTTSRLGNSLKTVWNKATDKGSGVPPEMLGISLSPPSSIYERYLEPNDGGDQFHVGYCDIRPFTTLMKLCLIFKATEDDQPQEVELEYGDSIHWVNSVQLEHRSEEATGNSFAVCGSFPCFGVVDHSDE
ncbi:hypothetical protein M422DRAFT_42219 [Sphaerobolus stellatus SS14]|nr:hypothetical protein M422DRAFT_42219 [Sphaerobolus stellatus SS14]